MQASCKNSTFNFTDTCISALSWVKEYCEKKPQCHLQLNNFLLFIIIMYLIMYLSCFLTLGDGSSALILGFSLWSDERVSLLGEPVTFAMTLAFFGLGLSSELDTLFFRTVVCVSMDCKIQKNIIYKSHHNIKLSLWQYMLNNFFLCWLMQYIQGHLQMNFYQLLIYFRKKRRIAYGIFMLIQ